MDPAVVKLTVGMPFNNKPECVIKSARHILNNCLSIGADAQLLLINDYSTPETIHQIKYAMPSVKIVDIYSEHGTNPNLGRAVNIALNMVRPDDDYYWNVESDVYPQPGCLEALIDGLTKNTDICAVRAEGGGTPAIPEKRRWWHMTCLLVRGEHARDPRIRIDETFRLWYADQDYGCTMNNVTGQLSLTITDAHMIHDGGASVNQAPAGHFPGCMSHSEAWAYAHRKHGW